MIVTSLLLAGAAAVPAPVTPTATAWRQIVAYSPSSSHQGGVSVWTADDAVIKAQAGRERGKKSVEEVWVNHGSARVAGQAFTVQRNTYDCDAGTVERGPISAYSYERDLLVTAARPSDPEPLIAHSAENEIHRAVCTSNVIAWKRRPAIGVAGVLQAGPPQPAPADPVQELQTDLDADGKTDRLSVHMRPHSYRLDVEVVLAKQANRPFTLFAVKQPPTGPLVYAKLRSVAPNAYVYACERVENQDAKPCRAGEANALRGAVEVVTPGQPSLLIWMADDAPRIVRLPELPGNAG